MSRNSFTWPQNCCKDTSVCVSNQAALHSWKANDHVLGGVKIHTEYNSNSNTVCLNMFITYVRTLLLCSSTFFTSYPITHNYCHMVRLLHRCDQGSGESIFVKDPLLIMIGLLALASKTNTQTIDASHVFIGTLSPLRIQLLSTNLH